MTTQTAQRGLLESLADLRHSPGLDTSDDALGSFVYGMQYAMELALAAGQPGVARIYANLISLALAVRDDQKEPA
jgi:hypothetical protein